MENRRPGASPGLNFHRTDLSFLDRLLFSISPGRPWSQGPGSTPPGPGSSALPKSVPPFWESSRRKIFEDAGKGMDRKSSAEVSKELSLDVKETPKRLSLSKVEM